MYWRQTPEAQKLAESDQGWWRILSLEECFKLYERRLGEATNAKERKEVRRELVLNDLFYLAVVELGRVDMVDDWIYERCREVELFPDGYLDLWSREHYKSTIITEMLTIQDILKDPEVTFGIFSFKKEVAQVFVTQIRKDLQSEKLYYLFPEILWAKTSQAPKWAEDSICVKRKDNPKEMTVEAHGLLKGMPTSRHFRKMVWDDVITQSEVSNPESIIKATDQFAHSLNLSTEGGVKRIVGTYYAKHDTYHDIEGRGTAIPRIYPCTESGTEDYDFEDAVLMSPDELRQRRKDQGEYIFSCQMLLNPRKAGAMGFNKAWLQYWDNDNWPGLSVILIVDPSSGKREEKGTDNHDYTAIWVLGLGADKRWRVIDLVRDKLSLSGRQKKCEQLYRRYNAMMMFYEEVGLQSDIEHFNIMGGINHYIMNIIPVHPKEMGKASDKHSRILTNVPRFEQGEILLPQNCIYLNHEKQAVDLIKVFIDEEYDPYPVVKHKDMLDGLAYINHPQVIAQVPLPKEKILQKVGQANQRHERQNMDVV